jgi:carbon-monoxide dehydrogenase large subunit
MPKYGIGQPVRRLEDRRFLTGAGQFVDDISLPHQCHGVVLYSSHAHAKIVRIDVSQALNSPGVVCVLTGADVIADGLGGMPPLFMPGGGSQPLAFQTLRPILVAERVRCVGDRVAFVVAETLAQAADAIEKVEVKYEPLPALTDLESAVKEDAEKIWDGCPSPNTSFRLQYGDSSKTKEAFAQAKHVVSVRLENNRITANSLEPRATIGFYDQSDGTYLLYTSSQNPHGVRTLVAGHVLRVPENRVRVVAPDVGGGFGLKSNAHVEDPLVLWASKRCGRPVKWTATRSEALVGDYHARDQVVYGEMAVAADGKILAIRADALQGVGAYTSAVCAAPIIFSLEFIPNVYDVKTVDLRTRGVFTNTSPVTAYRGTGRPEAIYLVERLIEIAAEKCALDPIEIRRRNLISPGAIPYKTATGVVYDSGEFARVLDRAVQLSDWDGFPVRAKETRKRGKVRGRGICFYIEPAGHDNERMEIRFDPGGTITVVAGTHSHGQGHATTYAQMISEWLGVDIASVKLVQGDTDKVSFGRGTFGARSSMNGGAALKRAADAVVARAKLMAAELLEADAKDVEFADAQFHVVGTDRTLPLTEVAKSFYLPSGITDKFGVALEGVGTFGTNPSNKPNGCHVCEVEIDPDTGATTVDRFTVVDDAGRVINPLLCEGQIHGGVAQGVGQALLEHVIYEPGSGQNLTASFMDYALPKAHHFPNFVTAFEEIPSTTNPLGVKGIGEAGAIGAPTAVMNAVIHALRPLGVTHVELPATPMRVWNAIQRAKGAGCV